MQTGSTNDPVCYKRLGRKANNVAIPKLAHRSVCQVVLANGLRLTLLPNDENILAIIKTIKIF